MKETIEQILSLWGMENEQVVQIYHSAWEINQAYVLKVYDDQNQLERNSRISEILSECNIPVAGIVPAKTGEKYVAHQNHYFLMTQKLQGSEICDEKDKDMARKMGSAMAQLHRAFVRCEEEVTFWDNSLLKEMKGWIRDNLAGDGWRRIGQEEYAGTVSTLESVYDSLPKQLIHRDVHFGNFLFFEGNLSGYIDFDLTQRNIRIFDICYFLTGLLAEEREEPFTQKEWTEIVACVVSGYEGVMALSREEKDAIPCVMACIEMLFVAYYLGINDTKSADGACQVLHFVQDCEREIRTAVG